MKFFLLTIFGFIFCGASAQDMIYPTTGDKIPAKVMSILIDKIKFKKTENLAGPDYSKSLSNVLMAFNAAGNYLVFNGKSTISDDEKNAFINETPAPKSTDILVDINGGVTGVNISAVKDAYVTIMLKGKPKNIQKSLLILIIRKDGTHQLLASADKAADFLANARPKIAQLTGAAAPVAAVAVTTRQTTTPTAVTTTPATAKITPAAPAADDAELTVDPKLFEEKAVSKVKEFNTYVNTIYQSGTTRNDAKTAIDLAVGLFRNEDSRVEVSSVNTDVKPSFKIRVYLDRLQLRSKQYDNVKVEYANINYASKFTQGTDGNWYATITFVQKFEGFIDGKMVYGDKTKKNLQVVLKKYEKVVNGETQKLWDVFFEDMGVVETKKV